MQSSFLTPGKLSGKVLISLWGHVTIPEPASQSVGLGMQHSGDQSRDCAHPWGPGLFSLCMQGYDSLCFSVSACKGWIIPERKRCCWTDKTFEWPLSEFFNIKKKFMFYYPKFTDKTEATCILWDFTMRRMFWFPKKALMAHANTQNGSFHCLFICHKHNVLLLAPQFTHLYF